MQSVVVSLLWPAIGCAALAPPTVPARAPAEAAMTSVSPLLDDVLDAKNGAIKDLQYELARVTKAHNDVIRVYESKLTEFGIPVEELGFRPLVTSTGTGPAGLVVA